MYLCHNDSYIYRRHASIWINCQRRHISFGLTSHPRVNNTNVKGILLLPKAIHYDNSTSHDAPVKSVFIGRIGYWKQRVYKSMTKTGTELRLLRDIYSVKKPYSNILLPYVDTKGTKRCIQ